MLEPFQLKLDRVLKVVVFQGRLRCFVCTGNEAYLAGVFVTLESIQVRSFVSPPALIDFASNHPFLGMGESGGLYVSLFSRQHHQDSYFNMLYRVC